MVPMQLVTVIPTRAVTSDLERLMSAWYTVQKVSPFLMNAYRVKDQLNAKLIVAIT